MRQVLGIERTSSGAEIKKAYHKLALQYHPGKPRSGCGVWRCHAPLVISVIASPMPSLLLSGWYLCDER
jgi:hypothetical protein